MLTEEIISRVEPGRTLHLVHWWFDESRGRVNLSAAEEPLQVACLSQDAGQTFAAHRHLPNARTIPVTQEAWVVARGSVRVNYYDVDDAFLCCRDVGPGGCSITFAGGHGYEILEDATLVYEFKNGPYLGREKDKELL